MSTNTPRSEPVKTGIAPWLSVSRATEAVDYYKACPGYLDYPFQNKLSALALSLTSPTYYA